MSAPAFEVVLDHRDPGHHDRMDRITRDLLAWATQHGVTQVVREERTLRPGVVKLTFSPAPRTPAARMSGDHLNLSKPS